MATVEAGTGAAASAPAADIWGGESNRCGGKITKRRALVAGGFLACAALALGLYIGLGKSADQDSSQIVQQGLEDPNSIGCYADKSSARVMGERITDKLGMTPDLCHTYCADGGYTYYALQWSEECWCGGASVDIDRHGAGVCDYPCAGDPDLICGGYYANTVYEVGTDASIPVAPSPTPTPTPSSTCDGTLADFRITSTTMYVETGGCATLTDIYNAQGSGGPLYVLDSDNEIVDGADPTGTWLLTRDLKVFDGATLYVHGTSVGGDCDVLRIQSTGSSDFYEIRGHGGSLSFHTTKVTSWDTDEKEEQLSYSGGRSFVNCVSEVFASSAGASSDDTCDGAAKNDMGECRMDIIDSVMGNMGYFDGESYGLTWKVRGFCTDLSNPEVFDRTGVYGDIQGSEIYGMYYGMYSYGHDAGVWKDNTMRDNILYGFDPHDDSDNLEISNNKVYGNGNHGIIASKRCNNVKIFDNEVYDGGEGAVGIFLHRSSNDAEVYGNYVHDMQDAGFALMETMDADIHDNVVENVKYGVRLSLGSAGNQIYDNSFDGCSNSGFYTYQGSDDPDVSNGRPSENVFTNNVISSTSIGVKIEDGDGNEFVDNVFTGTETLEFEDTTDTLWSGNTLPSGVCVEGDADFTSGSDSVPSC